MAVFESANTGLDYAPCRYGTSRTLFRGPAKSLDGDYVAVLGGTEAYGRFVASPFPDLIEQRLKRTIVNFGCINAGLDVFVQDPVVMRACKGAWLTVVQVIGAQNMSNRFYAVHPRRNDRFLRASKRMTEIWPEVDFTEIHFTRHLLSVLRATSPEQFDMLRDELSEAWSARMRSLARELGGRVVLLWMSDRAPDDAGDLTTETGPLFVTRADDRGAAARGPRHRRGRLAGAVWPGRDRGDGVPRAGADRGAEPAGAGDARPDGRGAGQPDRDAALGGLLELEQPAK